VQDVGILYGDFVYFTSILYSLWPFGIFMVIWYIFHQFLPVVPRKIWQPWSNIIVDQLSCLPCFSALVTSINNLLAIFVWSGVQCYKVSKQSAIFNIGKH
jgi:hypothetical protein